MSQTTGAGASQLFFDGADLWLAVCDAQGAVLAANEAWRGGFARMGRAPQTLADVLPRELVQTLAAANARGAVRQDRPMIEGPDGRWMEVDLVAVDDRLLCTLYDVTDSKGVDPGAEAARRSRNQLLRDAGVGSWRFDPDRDAYNFAPELLERAGAAPASLVPRALVDAMVHPDDLPPEREMRERIVREGGKGEIELRMRAPDGRWMHLRVRMRAGRRLASGRYEMYGLTQDVTELARARDAARAATEAKSSFLASVSHEIRTPMNGIVGVLHLLKSEPISDPGRVLLDEALACTGMLGQLINDVLDLSKIEAGKLELAPEPTHLPAAAQGVVSLIEPQAEAKGLSLSVEVEPSLGWVTTDPVRLRQCLFNLVGNAVKFTAVGGVAARISRCASGRLRVEVQDTGPGIPAEVQQRLFGRFEQADRSTTRLHGGTGLGLAITKSLVEMMGGAIGVASVEGEGSTFWFEVEAPACDPPASEPADSATDLQGLRVLIVDDNPTNRLVGSKILEALGAEASTCVDGEAAIAAVRDDRFDVVLMDINMPGIDGVEATRRIRALPSPVRDTPVLALTANVMAHQREAYLAGGMDGVVVKPFSPASLLAEIAQVLAPAGQSPDAAHA